MTSDPYGCGCRGTVHDPNCWVWSQAKSVPPPQHAIPLPSWEEVLSRKLDRIIFLLEEISGRRR
jgi:hypothetical protein